MCGINGIFSYSAAAPPVDPDELLRSRECMRSRGPDAADSWISDDRRVGLGHRRLAIIDLSAAGAQPMRRGERVIILDRKSTRLNSSHSQISYAVFCLKKKKVLISLC